MAKILTPLILFFIVNSFGAEPPLNFCLGANPRNFDPATTTDSPSIIANSRMLFDRLFLIDQDSKLQKNLIKNYSKSKDQKTYKLTLRHDVSFHQNWGFVPKRKLNADDVVFTFKRQTDKKLGLNQNYPFYKAYGLDRILKNVKRVSEHEVHFVLHQPYKDFLYLLALDFTSIQSAEYFEFLSENKRLAEWSNKPIGTGPFLLEHFKRDQFLKYKKNDSYFGENRRNRVNLVIVKDSLSRLQKIKAGECHIVAHPDVSTLNKVPKEVNIYQRPGNQLSYMAFNHKKDVFEDPNLKQLIFSAINLKNIQTALGKKYVSPMQGFLPKQFQFGQVSLKKDYVKFEKKVRKLKLYYPPINRPYLPQPKLVAQLIQDDLKKVGIETELITYDWGTYLQHLRKGRHDLALLGFVNTMPRPSMLLNLLTCDSAESGMNASHWCLQEYDRFLAKAQTSMTEANYNQNTKRALNILAREIPWVPLIEVEQLRLVRESLSDYYFDPMGAEYFNR